MANKFSNNIELGINDFTYKNNNIYIKNGNKGLVVVYAPWCGYCQMLVPEWKKMAKESSYMVKAINVEAGTNKKIVEKLGVQGFPTILYVNGEGKIGETYSGERNIEEFEKYLAKK